MGNSQSLRSAISANQRERNFIIFYGDSLVRLGRIRLSTYHAFVSDVAEVLDLGPLDGENAYELVQERMYNGKLIEIQIRSDMCIYCLLHEPPGEQCIRLRIVKTDNVQAMNKKSTTIPKTNSRGIAKTILGMMKTTSKQSKQQCIYK